MKEDLSAILDIWFDGRMRHVHTCLPGKIVEYDYKKRKAKIKPLIKLKFLAGEKVQVINIEEIANVPVIFPGTKKTRIHFPLSKDDGVLLLFSESPLGTYLNSSNEVEADNLTRFSLTDCIAIPGMWSFSNVPDAVDNGDDFFICFQDAVISIKDKDNDIKAKNKKGYVSLTKDGDIEAKVDGKLNITAGNTNKITTSSTGMKFETSSQKIEMGSSSTKINDNLEVLV